ncbi:MAG: hypothetical protein KKB30_01655 [Proteobacteria bacterium]|nr:hypothetical protein [Pseudomonadota bacterium]MBU1716801.1 hypothetical protein [Pseudomonadota bacterium]
MATKLAWPDFFGKLRARLGLRRDSYLVSPGLYCVGQPDHQSPVLVTANYKLTFDALRSQLGGLDAWILVLDTFGVNVWCAAGKKNFSTRELVRRIELCGLSEIVSHRRLILPQLGAPGVAAHQVKKESGFEVKWGPIRAADLKKYLADGLQATPVMREVTFSLSERMVLVPVELTILLKPSFYVLALVLLLSGIGPDFFSVSRAWGRGSAAFGAYGLGVLAGAGLVPLLLPWIPGRQFFLKGIEMGVLVVTGAFLLWGKMIGSGLESLALISFVIAVSSYTAMNFTGATPFTSLSGVEKEMRQGLPVQIAALVVAIVGWLASPFF